MIDFLSNVLIIVYFLTACMVMIYGLNCYVMIALFKGGRKPADKRQKDIMENFKDLLKRDDPPFVTTQIPVFNELNVVERVINAACRMRYPDKRHEIQVLDDSTDETSPLIDEVVKKLFAQGYDVKVIRRKKREGFKAGALAEGLKHAKGDLIAIFDADFVPPIDYLLRTVPFFMAEEKVGLVQARWGHLNCEKSLLTRAQSIGIDGHFMVEQSARTWSGLYMNFNGTAGIWRRQAIMDGGGWQWDTLTEDMDLSYRVQFAGWRTAFIPDLEVPAEIPEDVSAFKSQQFRWAKGSIQTALKLLPDIFRSSDPLFKKIEAFFHLTHYMVHPMMVTLAVLALPVLLSLKAAPGPFAFFAIVIVLSISMIAPSALYVVSQRACYNHWVKRIIYLPFLVVVGVGIAISNSRAVAEAILGIKSGFIRTPKKGDMEMKRYNLSFPWSIVGYALTEILIGIYCAWSLGYYLSAGKYLVGPFLAVYASGFLFVGILTLAHSLGFSE